MITHKYRAINFVYMTIVVNSMLFGGEEKKAAESPDKHIAGIIARMQDPGVQYTVGQCLRTGNAAHLLAEARNIDWQNPVVAGSPQAKAIQAWSQKLVQASVDTPSRQDVRALQKRALKKQCFWGSVVCCTGCLTYGVLLSVIPWVL